MEFFTPGDCECYKYKHLQTAFDSYNENVFMLIVINIAKWAAALLESMRVMGPENI